MLSINPLLSALIQRSLAAVIVSLMSLMPLGVDSCETSCLLGHLQCADESAQFSAMAQPMGSSSSGMAKTPGYARLATQIVASSTSALLSIESVSCRSDESCKDASRSVMRPAGRTELQKDRSTTVGVAPVLYWSTRECLNSKTESPPPKATSRHLRSVILRI
jgi:hypothetical protein